MIVFDNFCIIGHRNEYSSKQVQTLSLQPNYVSTLPGKTKNSTKPADCLLHVVRSVEPIVSNFRRKSFNVCFFPYLLQILLGVVWQKIFSILTGFVENLSSNSIWFILACKLMTELYPFPPVAEL